MERVMGKVLTEAKVENIGDVFNASRGALPADQIRSMIIKEALVDTGAWGLSMPKAYIERLGLSFLKMKKAMTAAGVIDVRVFGTVRLTIMDRECPMDVTELPNGCPVLIGQLPLEAMDFVVDTRTHKLTGNPAHGGEQIYELYTASEVAHPLKSTASPPIMP
jgi:predicted aspartyl protease